MHEIGIANSILEAVSMEMAHRPGSVPRTVGVRIGELSAVDPDALRFAFEVLRKETGLATLELRIEMCPRRHLCPNCHFEFTVVEFDACCPECRHASTKCIGGDQLEVAYFELEEHEPDTA